MKVEIEEGQIWSYAHRKNEERSLLTIIKIEEKRSGEKIIHISVDGLSIKSVDSVNGVITSIDHLPFSIDAFEKSIYKVKDKIHVSINEGYLEWQAMYDQNKAGIWAIGVAKVLTVIEESIKS